MNVNRAFNFIARYGIRKGINIYLDLKYNRVSKIRVPGIRETIFLRRNTSDAAIFDQVFLRGDYDMDFKFLPLTIVDAGAHIGLFSIVMKNRFPNAKLICIEPDKNNFETLNKNLSRYSHVEALRAGLWNRNSKLKIVDRYTSGHSALTVEENIAEGSIPAVTIGSVMETFGLNAIDVLKIDIETSEKDLFSKNYEEWLPKVRMIIIELHDWLKPGCSKAFFEAINKSYRNYGYSVYGENTIIENSDFEY